MPDGPTQEGSIVAFLKLDDSDWNRKLDEAEQRARDLGRVDPTIRVRADTADALAKLEEVRMAAAQSGVTDLTTHITTTRTDETTTRSSVEDAGAKGVQDAVAARNAAMARYNDAAEAAAQAQKDLSAAESQGSATAGDLAAAQTRAAETARDVESAQQDLNQSALNIKTAMDGAAAATRRQEAAQRSAAETALKAASSSSEVTSNVAQFEEASRAAADAELARAAASHATSDADHGVSTAARDAGVASEDLATASDHAARSLGRAGNNANRVGGYYGMILAVLGALLPIAGPLAGYVAGVGGAFMGMGTAGVMAVLGIKNEMAAGTTQGRQYTALMGELETDLHSMEDAAASGVLAPFSDMVRQITANMPQLTAELDGFAGDLGGIGSTVVGTLISGFQTLNPLFAEGAQYVQHLASEWAGWVNNGGLNRFAADAEQALPIVAADLGGLLSIAMKLISGLAPLATTMLGALEPVIGFLNSLPTPVVLGFATAITAVVVEFRMWNTIGAIIEKVAAMMGILGFSADAALGPVALVVMGVSALAAGFGFAALSTQHASQATQDYTVALEQSNGVIDENIRKQVAQKLQTAGVLDTARQYGLALSTVTDAALGNRTAQQAVNDAIQKNGMMTAPAARNMAGLSKSTRTLTPEAKALSAAVNGQNQSLDDAIRNYKNIADASSGAASSQTVLQAQAQAVTSALAVQAGFAVGLTNDLKLMNGMSLSQVQAQTAQAAAINSVSTSIKTNGVAINGNSAAAVANQQALEAAVTAIDQNGEAIATATGSQAKGTAAILAGRDALLQQLSAQHQLTPAIQDFINKILAIPTEHNVDIAVDTVQAQGAISQVSGWLNSLQSKTVDLNVVEHTYGVGSLGSAPGHAMGGTIGGTVSGPGTSTSDSILSWLSAGEEVISNANGQASQYRAVLKAINRGAPAPQIMAAMPAGGQTTQVTHVHNTFNVTSNDPEQTYQYVMARMNQRAMV